ERMRNLNPRQFVTIGCCLVIFMVLMFVRAEGISAHGRVAGTSQGAGKANAATPPAAKAGAASKSGASAPCGDKSKRDADCGNGTVTDTATGLIWLKQSDCVPAANWEAAKMAVAALKDGDCMLKDGSAPGDWRLPTNAEWEATMKDAKAKGC